ncbi:hypothetical protein LCGC14_1385590 [marine sediment metagenome]|uniref:Uncharacterized protein n=1 Tax=marine sediment metagenome TaxID=412755 RepID=A0A0F9K1H8_9ZZZZ
MSMPNTGITLGKTYRDPVTGFQGIALAITYWLHGCARVMLECGVVSRDTGAVTASQEWFDTDRVKNYEVVEAPDLTADAIPTKSASVTGGPMDQVDPGRSVDPGR